MDADSAPGGLTRFAAVEFSVVVQIQVDRDTSKPGLIALAGSVTIGVKPFDAGDPPQFFDAPIAKVDPGGDVPGLERDAVP